MATENKQKHSYFDLQIELSLELHQFTNHS